MLELVLAALAGLLIGSFLNVCIYRMPQDLSVVRPRSYCPHCKRPVAWYDNVPLLSFALLRGRCRHCGGAISVRYPAVEALTAALFVLVVALFGPTLVALKYCLFSALIVGLIFTDLEERILPDEFTLGGAAAGILLAAFVPLEAGITWLLFPQWGPAAQSVAESVLGATVASGAIWLVGFLYHKIRGQEGLGFGDVKMVAMIGAFLGVYGALVTIVVGSVLGSVLGLAYILIAGKSRTYELPFGSFLGAGAILVGLLGQLSW
jgi:leader peptidase (prepilin peptidase) / N-methyltransferase